MTLPDVHDPLLGPFWTAARERRVVVPECRSCSSFHWPPGRVCPRCHSRDIGWAQVEGRGRLWSYAVYHRALAGDLGPPVPYAVGLVELPEGPRLIGRITSPIDACRVGAAVEPVFEDASDEVTLLCWAIVGTRR
jgi:uncharacterized protein